jgi:hypothetical protein
VAQVVKCLPLQVQSPEFKPQYTKKRKRKKEYILNWMEGGDIHQDK